MLSDIIFALLSIAGGILVSFGIYWGLDKLVNFTPDRIQKRIRAYAYLLPAAVLLISVLLIPLIQTIIYSFMNSNGRKWVGLENYVDLFTDQSFLGVLLNNFLWVAFVPAATVGMGLLIASLTNQVGPTREKVFKSLIFMPMSISFVSAATIWSFIYVAVPPGRPNVGLLNALVETFGGEPQPWMLVSEWRLNSFLLMIIVIWLQAGFAMVLLSAAIKAVPEETMEAARVDGAGHIQVFWQIILPQIWGTVMAVFITVLITVMKIFDIVLAMTGGTFETSVLGFQFYQEYFLNSNVGKASAIVTILTLLIVPLMYVQIRTVRHQESLR
jgi:alpha-glucoside transport system permease protein